jgi:RsiW-degrading membrane proteinase PrsW (M82 family)
MEFNTVSIALLAGILPAFLWLWFWLREDHIRPEPRGLIFATFLLGMSVIPFVIIAEKYVAGIFTGQVLVIILWASIEEVGKFLAAWVGGLRTCAHDEPIDPLIYMITAALGFAALENALFLLGPLNEGNVLLGFITGNVRFIGATLLHTVTSGAIGFMLGLSFYQNRASKKMHLFGGLILAILLHTFFNYFILAYTEVNLFLVFTFVWIGIILLILSFEKVKRIKQKLKRPL